MLTYPRFAKACYAFFAVAVLAAVLKLSISGAEPALLKMLPAAPTASAVEPADRSPQDPEDSRLGSFSDGEEERLEAAFARSVPREDALEGSDEGPNSSSGDASVFRRPSLNRDSYDEPVCGDLGDVPRSSRVVFPLPEDYFNSYDDTWGAARPQGGHEGSDLMSPAGTPEFALTDGRLVAIESSNENGWNKLGGYTVMLEAANDVGPIKKGDLFYYAHMDRESSLPVGTQVRAGQRIGTVGDTGEGPEVTRGKFPPHLHLGWYDANLSEERSAVESGAMNPYPLLLWLERNGGAVSGGTDASYCQAPQSPNPTPSTGEIDWPTPSVPGETPDLDTGDGSDPSPQIRGDEPHHDHEGQDREGNHPKQDRDKNQQKKDRNKDNPGQDQGKVNPERDDEGQIGEGEQGEGAGAEQPADDEAEKPANDENSTEQLSLRKKLKAEMATVLRDLPNAKFDRTALERGGEENQDAKDDGREGGKQDGKKQEEKPQRGDRPVEAPPENKPTVPSEEAPKEPAPVVAIPERQRPAPEATDGKAGAAKGEPEVTTPPDAVRESPVEEPEPLTDAEKTEPVEPFIPRDEIIPAPAADAVSAAEEAAPNAEPEEVN